MFTEIVFCGFIIPQHTTDNTGGYGQDLISPGSCLEEFRTAPIIECHGHGRCNYYDPLASFWLTVIEDGNMFKRPEPVTLKKDFTSKVSRCAVCRKKDRIVNTHSHHLPSASELVKPPVDRVSRPTYHREDTLGYRRPSPGPQQAGRRRGSAKPRNRVQQPRYNFN